MNQPPPGRVRVALFACALGLSVTACAAVERQGAEKRDAALQARLAALTLHFEGDVGIYVRHLGDGRTAAIRADELFPTASMIKVPILIGVFDALERSQLEYRKPLVYETRLEYDDHDMLARFGDEARIDIAELATLMCTFSDNTASLWLQDLAGGGASINTLLDAHGYHATRVNSRTDGRKAEKAEFGWGQTTPREMATMLVSIRERKLVSPAASAEMDRVLGRSFWTGEALSPLPTDVHVISKQGAVSRSCSEVLLVSAPHGDYVACVITKNQADESFDHDNAGFRLLRDVSREVWEAFEGSAVEPVSGADRYR